MADLFSAEFMAAFADAWNNEPELSGALSRIGFNSSIGYGFDNEDKPRGVLIVENGKAISGEAYNGQTLNWDLRADASHWQKWMQKPPGMMALGVAYTSRKLKFNLGDYAAMIKDPRMAGPFVKSFAVMGQAQG